MQLFYFTCLCTVLKGKFLNCVLRWRTKQIYFQNSEQTSPCLAFVERFGFKSLAYCAALFGKLNNLNLNLQGKVTTSSSFVTNPQAFYLNLQNWHPKVLQWNTAVFEKLTKCWGKHWRTWWKFKDRDHLSPLKLSSNNIYLSSRRK